MTQVQERLAIDHPAQEDWLRSSLDTPNEQQCEALRARFSRTLEDVDAIINAVGTASLMSDVYRQNYEFSTIGERGLGLSIEEREQYRELVRHPEAVTDLIAWFSWAAYRYYLIADAPKKVPKLGLEIGGKRQGGDWESTGPLDNIVRAIPAQSAKKPDMNVRVLEEPFQRAIVYRFMPLTSLIGPDQEEAFDFGLIRRRRAVADIAMRESGLQPTKLFKESLGLVVMNQLTEEDRKTIYEDVKANPAKNVLLKQRDDTADGEYVMPENNTVAALTAGRIFEEAIKSKVGTSTDISPISAHYVVTVKNPIAN